LQNLSVGGLPGGAPKLQVVGPVILTLATGTILNCPSGATDHPEWLELRVSAGGLTVSGNNPFHGNVTCPSGTVTLNATATLTGRVICDRLLLNGNSALIEPVVP
ncbi:MAG TPA: polymer-forming cytoskeletal protein, partial [Lacunisphaera sp.]|nr:polymer-forming cytoskeletal protein [Lacunisphaera sp.]